MSNALGTDGANIPEDARHGGMTVKFVQSSDNKYVQFRLMLSTFTTAQFTNTANWQGVDDEPAVGSNNLVKSGGVADTTNKIKEEVIYTNELIKQSPTTISSEDFIFGKYFDPADNRVYSSDYRAYTKSYIQCEQNQDIKVNLGNYTATVVFYDEDKMTIGFNVWFNSFTSFATVAGAKYFRIQINSSSELSSNTYVPISYDFSFYNRKEFCDIKNLATEFPNTAITPSTGVLEGNYNYKTFLLPNRGYSKILLEAAWYHNNDVAISFYSNERLSLDGRISYINSIGTGDAGDLKKILADVPNGCKLIALVARTASNPVVNISTLSCDVVDKEISNIVDNISTKNILFENLKYGYFDASTGVFSPVIDGNTVCCVQYVDIKPYNVIYLHNPASYNIAVFWYGKDKGFLSCSWFSGRTFLQAPANAYYVRMAFRNATMLDFSNVTLRKKESDEADTFSISIRDLLQGYIGDNGESIGSHQQRVFYPVYIAVNKGGDYAVQSNEFTNTKVDCYNSEHQYLFNLGWFTTAKQFHIPTGVCYIRLSFEGTNVQSLSNDILFMSEQIFRMSVVQSQKFLPFTNLFEIAHLFINESVAGENIIIPSQSLADIEIAARLGFSFVELNVHSTSDGNYVTIHGVNGKFGNQVQHIDGTTDISDISIGSVTLDYIKQNVRYKSNYAKYRTSIPTLQEACLFAKNAGISIYLSMTGVISSKRNEVINICRNYFCENFIVGVYGDTAALEARMIFKGTISNYSSTISSEGVDAVCKKIGAPYIHCVDDSITNDTSNDVLKGIADAAHSQNCYVAFADAYRTRTMATRMLHCGFDIAAGTDFSVNKFENGNICNLSGDISFDKFTTTGTITDNNMVLSDGDTIEPNITIDSCFLGGGYMQIRFVGKLTFVLGKINETIESDGTLPIILSSIVLNNEPTFTITSVGATTVLQIIYKATKY